MTKLRTRLERLERTAAPLEAHGPAATFYLPDNGRDDLANPHPRVVIYEPRKGEGQ